MSLGFRHDSIRIDGQCYALAIRPLDQIIQHYGGLKFPNERTSTSWTSVQVEWAIVDGYLVSTGLREYETLSSFFDGHLPEIFKPFQTDQHHAMMMVDFTGMIPLKPRAWDAFQQSMSPSYADASQVPDWDYELLLVIQSGRLVNQIVNLTCLADIEQRQRMAKAIKEEKAFLAVLHTVPTKEDYDQHEARAYKRWFRYKAMFDDDILPDSYYEIY